MRLPPDGGLRRSGPPVPLQMPTSNCFHNCFLSSTGCQFQSDLFPNRQFSDGDLRGVARPFRVSAKSGLPRFGLALGHLVLVFGPEMRAGFAQGLYRRVAPAVRFIMEPCVTSVSWYSKMGVQMGLARPIVNQLHQKQQLYLSKHNSDGQRDLISAVRTGPHRPPVTG